MTSKQAAHLCQEVSVAEGVVIQLRPVVDARLCGLSSTRGISSPASLLLLLLLPCCTGRMKVGEGLCVRVHGRKGESSCQGMPYFVLLLLMSSVLLRLLPLLLPHAEGRLLCVGEAAVQQLGCSAEEILWLTAC